jgi:hypothetical protein
MHPDEEELLRFADGESAPRRADEIRRHLESCWECRAGLAEVQAVIGRCVRYRKQVLGEHLPPPPNPWMDIGRRFEAMDAEPVPVRERLQRLLRVPLRALPRWAPVAVALALLGALLYQLRETPSVEAAALLRKAVAASQASPAPSPRIRIRTPRRDLTRAPGAAQTVAARPEWAAVEAMFKLARYDWNDPLSARSFQQWRDGLADRRDEVTAHGESYRIRTSTASGALAAASLMLRAGDLRPLETRLDFRNREWVEVTEAPAGPEPPSATVAAVIPPPAPAPAHAGGTAPALPRPATPEEELRVLEALNRLGADLGDPIEVTRADGRVLVSGIGLAPARRHELEKALAGLSNVDVRFADAAPAPLSLPPLAEASGGTGQGPLQLRLEQQAGGRPRFERLTVELLDASDTAMARAHALRRLARKFPPADEAALGNDGRRLLGKLDQEHSTALLEQSVTLERLIGPLLEAMGAVMPAEPFPDPENWQTAAENAFLASRRVESLLAATLGMSAAGAPDQQLPSELLAALARMKAAAQACVRMVPLEARR